MISIFLDVDQAVFQRNLQKELRQDTSDDVAEKFVEGFQEYIEEPARWVLGEEYCRLGNFANIHKFGASCIQKTYL